MPFLGAGSLLQNDEWIAHGTAVLVAAVDQAGVIRIAPRCGVRVVSQWFDQPNAKFISTASAIATAIAQMNAGDVLLVESSSIVPDSKFGLLPAEVDPVVFDLIKTATGNGITVVEPAGNNDTGSNLDALRTGAVALSLTASSLPSGDSGAIKVSAASSNVPHQRLWYSNYGSRVDCFAWGWDIATCGDPAIECGPDAQCSPGHHGEGGPRLSAGVTSEASFSIGVVAPRHRSPCRNLDRGGGILPKGLWFFPAVGLSSVLSLGSTAAEGLPRIG